MIDESERAQFIHGHFTDIEISYFSVSWKELADFYIVS